MKTFQYEGISHSGVQVTGVIQARDTGEAEYLLREKLYSVTKITEDEKESLLDRVLPKKIDQKALALVCRQFAIILNAGMPIVRTVELVSEQTEDKQLHAIISGVAEDVSAGFSIADSFSRRGPKLPTTFVETVRAGEESGNLELAFSQLAAYFGKRSDTHKKLITALTYPAFVIVVAVIVVAIIMIKAVPVFTSNFMDMGLALPWPTRALIAVSNFFQKFAFIIFLLICLAIAGLRVYGSTPNGALVLADLYLKIPLLGKIQQMNSAAELASTLSTMLSTGVPAIRALTVTGRSLTNAAVGNSIDQMVEDVEAGFGIGVTMRKSKYMPELLCEMTAMGEESGSLEETLRVIGEYYDSEVETLSTRAVGLLEPITICVLAVIVVFILLAVYLPMFSMYDSIA